MISNDVRWYIAAALILGLCAVAAVVTELRARRRVTSRPVTDEDTARYLTLRPFPRQDSTGSDE